MVDSAWKNMKWKVAKLAEVAELLLVNLQNQNFITVLVMAFRFSR